MSATVKHWLDGLSLSQYHPLLVSSGYDTLTKCAVMTDSDLVRIGIVMPGHKKRILSHLATAKEFAYVNSSSRDGCDVDRGTSDDYDVATDGDANTAILIDFDSPDVVVAAEPDYMNVGRSGGNNGSVRRKKEDGDVATGKDFTDDAEAKRPVPLPRRPVPQNVSAAGETPVPQPRAKRPSMYTNVVGATVGCSTTDEPGESETDKSSKTVKLVETDESAEVFETAKPVESAREILANNLPPLPRMRPSVRRGAKVVREERREMEAKIETEMINETETKYETEMRTSSETNDADYDNNLVLHSLLSISANTESSFDVQEDVTQVGSGGNADRYGTSPKKTDDGEREMTIARPKLLVETENEHLYADAATVDEVAYASAFNFGVAIPPISSLQDQERSADVSNEYVAGNLIDVGTCSDDVQPYAEVSAQELNVRPFPNSPTSPGWYSPVWNMTSGTGRVTAVTGRQRSEIKSDISIDDKEYECLDATTTMTTTMTPPIRSMLPVAATTKPREDDPGNVAAQRLPVNLPAVVKAVRLAPAPPVRNPVATYGNTSFERGEEDDFLPVGVSPIEAPPLIEFSPATPASESDNFPRLKSVTPPPMTSTPDVASSAALVRPFDADATAKSKSKAKSPVPPPLPPKVGNPFQAFYDPNRLTYCFAEDDADEERGEEARLADISFAESDDTLSDGGEFWEIGFRRPSLDVLQNSIPIIPSSQIRITDRKGYLFKLISQCKKRTKLGSPWQKRWVVFDSRELRYYSTNKSFVSKRIIPVCTMVNIETDIKTNDLRPYRFKLTSVDRVYTFAADDVDDLSFWANIIMQAIIENKTEIENFVEGGEMSHPEIEGFVRMEGSKMKRYLVIKKAKFCFYNTINDFKSFTPIHRVEMQLASVKDIGKFKLQLHTPHVAFMLMYDSQEELTEWKDVFEDSIAMGLGDDSVIKEIYSNPSNRYCADCDMPDPEWASVNLGITLCKYCAGAHRSLPRSKVRSLRMDSKVWKPSVRQLLIQIGNDNSNNFWEWNASEDVKIDKKADPMTRKDYLFRKYCDKLYCRFHPLHGQQIALNEALCKMVQFGKVLETLELIFSGADIRCTKNNETPILLAKKAKQLLQEEFLYQNGGDAEENISPTCGVTSRSTGISHSGFLFKTGSNVKGDFLRRWCTLENGVFSYYDNDKSTVAKDCIDKKDMLSVSTAVDDRYDFTFEVGTTKQCGRIFLFAAESVSDRALWMNKLGKVMAKMGPDDVEKISAMDRGGNIFIRSGSTTEWNATWMQVCRKILSIFSQKDREFEEIDLRKAKSITFRHTSEKCLESFDEGPPFVIDLQNGQSIYFQSDIRHETERWFTAVQKAIMEADNSLNNQSLTSDSVPVIVEKCISFIATYGIEVEGIYRLNGQHSKVTRLLEMFMQDARSLVLKLELYQVHDVANALKRFFRSLDDPLLTSRYYGKWIETTNITDCNVRLQWYKYLLTEIPEINYVTLKRIITHLARIVEFEKKNKMTIINLASIFGPVLMRLDLDTQSDSGYGSTNLEISVVKDLLENHVYLFEVKVEELEQEKKIEEAMKRIEKLNTDKANGQIEQMHDVLIGVYVHHKEGQVISLKVTPQMRIQELESYVIEKAKLKSDGSFSIFEVVCNGDLERPLHYMEGIVEVTMTWSTWPLEFCRDNYLCIKRNDVYEGIERVFDLHASMFCELRYASKNRFRKYCFEFSRYCLTYRTNAKASSPTASWNVEDMTIYLGAQQQRNAPDKWCFSFVSAGEQLVSPFFGHCICCNSREELYKWLAALLRAQHPEGLFPSGSPRVAAAAAATAAGAQSAAVGHSRVPGASSHPEAAQTPSSSSSDAPRTRWPKPAFLQKLGLR